MRVLELLHQTKRRQPRQATHRLAIEDIERSRHYCEKTAKLSVATNRAELQRILEQSWECIHDQLPG
jgi:hypothetical protein